MKKTLSQANKDLDLRRFGKDVYSKALGEGEEVTEDDLVKYYTQGKYSKLEDVPKLDIDVSNSNAENFTLDEIVTDGDLYFSVINALSNISGPFHTLEESQALQASNYLNIHGAIYVIDGVTGTTQDNNLFISIRSASKSPQVSMEIVQEDESNFKISSMIFTLL